MNDIDLTDVDPRRWGEARRRIGVIREWTAKRRHTKAECVAAAALLGMTPKHFMTLVSAWNRHGDVARLGGLGMRRGTERGRRTMPDATRKVVTDVLEEFGPDARFAAIVAEANRRCDEASTPPASYGMVHHLLMQARRRPETRAGAVEVLIGEVACMLPTLHPGGGIALPILVVAVLMPETILIAHRLFLSDGTRADVLCAVLADVIAARTRRPIIVARNLAVTASITDRMEFTGSGARVGSRSEILTGALGSHIGTIPIRHRWKRDGAVRPFKDQASISAPLSPADAQEAIVIAIAAHNMARAPSGSMTAD